MYSDFEIRQLPLTLRLCREQAERFLTANGLRLDDVDYYAGLFRLSDDRMVAGGGLKGNVVKCVAVDSAVRDEGLANRLVSHLVNVAAAAGHGSVRVFTSPANAGIFTSLGFSVIARAERAVLLENGQGLAAYCHYLHSLRREGTTGVIVMNANPFTLGHRYLVEQAARQVDQLYVIAVREDCSDFTYSERLAMIQAGTEDIRNVTVCEGSDYAVSATTFPTYFLKTLTDATDTHITLDLDLFATHIAPALQASVRFVGTEPTDALTRRYNELMRQQLPSRGIRVAETERLAADGVVVSASRLREALAGGSLQEAARWAVPSTVPYLIARLATRAMQQELDTTPKPGLVDQADSGAHSDMDHALMAAGIRALHPYLLRAAQAGFGESFPEASALRQIGVEGEAAMMSATHGVNTHRGALFSLGLTAAAAAHLFYMHARVETAALQAAISRLAAGFTQPENTHGAEVSRRYQVGGALRNALSGYDRLFTLWLPYCQAHRADAFLPHKLLLLIMSSLEDSNVYHRRGAEAAEWVKSRAAAVLNDFSPAAIEALNRDFIERNISPGGSADMLALTIFVGSVVMDQSG